MSKSKRYNIVFCFLAILLASCVPVAPERERGNKMRDAKNHLRFIEELMRHWYEMGDHKDEGDIKMTPIEECYETVIWHEFSILVSYPEGNVLLRDLHQKGNTFFSGNAALGGYIQVLLQQEDSMKREQDINRVIDDLVFPITDEDKRKYTAAGHHVANIEDPDGIKVLVSKFFDSRPTQLAEAILGVKEYTIGDYLFLVIRKNIAQADHKAYFSPSYMASKESLRDWVESNNYELKKMREIYKRDHQEWLDTR